MTTPDAKQAVFARLIAHSLAALMLAGLDAAAMEPRQLLFLASAYCMFR